MLEAVLELSNVVVSWRDLFNAYLGLIRTVVGRLANHAALPHYRYLIRFFVEDFVTLPMPLSVPKLSRIGNSSMIQFSFAIKLRIIKSANVVAAIGLIFQFIVLRIIIEVVKPFLRLLLPLIEISLIV